LNRRQQSLQRCIINLTHETGQIGGWRCLVLVLPWLRRVCSWLLATTIAGLLMLCTVGVLMRPISTIALTIVCSYVSGLGAQNHFCSSCGI
jgi:hypothetical protein